MILFLYQMNVDLLILYVKYRSCVLFYLTQPHDNFFQSEKFQDMLKFVTGGHIQWQRCGGG